MKKLLSIPLMMLIAFSGFSLKYSAHFCQGAQVASEISLSGRIATCGMEKLSEVTSPVEIIRKHCCDNVTTSYSTSWNYIPSVTQAPEKTVQPTFDLSLLSNYSDIGNTDDLNQAQLTKPPGSLYPNSVSLLSLCVFRI
jgi:hypothetical protein